ncbi:MAG: carbohydrate kinase family protein [Gemmatales bacterium]
MTTRSENGVDIVPSDGSDPIHVDVVPAVTPLDPTGVGDGFRAGFLVGLARGLRFERAAQLGAMIATLVLECESTQGWDWDQAAAVERIRSAYGDAAAADINAVL